MFLLTSVICHNKNRNWKKHFNGLRKFDSQNEIVNSYIVNVICISTFLLFFAILFLFPRRFHYCSFATLGFQILIIWTILVNKSSICRRCCILLFVLRFGHSFRDLLLFLSGHIFDFRINRFIQIIDRRRRELLV